MVAYSNLNSPKLSSFINSLEAMQNEIEEHIKSINWILENRQEALDLVDSSVRKTLESYLKLIKNMGNGYKELGETVYSKWSELWNSEGRPAY